MLAFTSAYIYSASYYSMTGTSRDEITAIHLPCTYITALLISIIGMPKLSIMVQYILDMYI